MVETKWVRIHFDWISLVLWGTNFMLYWLLLLDRVESVQFQILSWMFVGTVVAFLIGTYAVPSRASYAISREDKDSIIGFSLFGFVAAVVFYILIEFVADLRFRFSVLDKFDSTGIMVALSAAINEEVLRWGLLRFFGFWIRRGKFLVTIGHVSLSDIFVGGLVNTFWTFYHSKSYVDAPMVVWVSLWISGAIITTCMYLSEYLLVAIAIHGFWNLAVSINLATIILSAIGAG